MKRTVKVLHRTDEGQYLTVFEWTTKKKGSMNEVIEYLFNKFRHSPPAKYDARPLRVGDRLYLRVDEGPLTGEVQVYEMISGITLRRV